MMRRRLTAGASRGSRRDAPGEVSTVDTPFACPAWAPVGGNASAPRSVEHPPHRLILGTHGREIFSYRASDGQRFA